MEQAENEHPKRLFFSFLAAIILQLVGFYYFSSGFFVYKYFTLGHSPIQSSAHIVSPFKFHKLVVMVVDALRHDFVFGPDSDMTFLNSLIAANKTVPLISKAQAPTVTMPRIKALTAGIIPNFLDFILNFESTALKDDNWLYQMKAAGKKMVFYGDDTWLRLFPNYFERFDGTTSFFVTDTVQVDLNVTRHIPDELQRKDWDVMILHYLGLDHIGHCFGAKSPLMKSKQSELDAVVKSIYEALEEDKEKKSLFIITGDHGMTDNGNHGGSSYNEVSTAIVFASPQFQEKSVGLAFTQQTMNQVDLVPTLSALFDISIPKGNTGMLIAELLAIFPDEIQLEWYEKNVVQMTNLMNSFIYEIEDLSITDIEECEMSKSSSPKCVAHHLREFNKLKSSDDVKATIEEARILLRLIKDFLSSSFSGYDLHRMVFGFCLIGISAIFCAMLLIYHMPFKLFSVQNVLPLIEIALYSFSLFSSSFIEEEHEIWYFICSSHIIVLLLQRNNAKQVLTSFALLACVRLHRSWNSTGFEYANYPDIRKWLNENMEANYVLFIISCAIIYYSFVKHLVDWRSGRKLALSCWTLGMGLVLVFKMNVLPDFNVSIAQGTFILIALLLAHIIHHSPSMKHTLDMLVILFTIFNLLIQRMHNSFLFILFMIERQCLLSLLHVPRSNISLSALFQTVLLYSFHQMSYFAFGQSNLIATIDVNNGFIGQSSFNMIWTGLLLFISIWAGPIYWVFANTRILLSLPHYKLSTSQYDPVKRHAYIIMAMRAIFQCFLSLSMLILRNHIFIWTVFSPRFLYELFWTLYFTIVFGCHIPVLIK